MQSFKDTFTKFIPLLHRHGGKIVQTNPGEAGTPDIALQVELCMALGRDREHHMAGEQEASGSLNFLPGSVNQGNRHWEALKGTRVL